MMPPLWTVPTEAGSVQTRHGRFPAHFMCHAVCLSGHRAAAIC